MADKLKAEYEISAVRWLQTG